MIQDMQHSNNSLSLSEKDINRLLAAFPRGVIVFDLETTGLSSLCDKIIEIGAIKITPNNKIQTFESLINPEILIPQRSIDIHGIENEMVSSAPKTEEVVSKFKNYIEDLPLVAHNAQFDIGFIVFQFHSLGIELGDNQVFCSCQYARRTLKKSKNHKLSTLCQHLEIELENHHRATDDAVAALKVFIESIKKDPDFKFLEKANILKLSDYQSLDANSEFHEILNRLTGEEYLAKMIYSGGTHKDMWRPIKPVAMLPTPRGDVLYAHCLISDLYKSFLIKKIQKIEECSESEIKKLVEEHS